MNVETSSGPGKRSLLRSRSDGEILNSATTYVPNPGPYLTPPTTPHSLRDGTDLSPSVPRLQALSNREHARSRLAALRDGSIEEPVRYDSFDPWFSTSVNRQAGRRVSPFSHPADPTSTRDRQTSHADKCRTGTRLEGEERPPNRKIREEVRAENTQVIVRNRLICAALPLVNSQGTSITCTTQNDLQQRIAATGASSSSNYTSSAASSVAASATGGAATSSSLTLLDSLINTGFEDDGTNEFSSESGEIASITSSNNFINYCSTVNLPLTTNGTQVKAGSCNAAPMGAIAATTAMPSAKFVNPPNLGSVLANTNFTVVLAIRNLETGWFVKHPCA
ncbi:uncharacterized protein B0H18DRAFT_1215604 [Fomitopsis serialis]|uniref:uncharacterized protein n=1 Tax=Fomitopsis serialis TaxID=139415 RepID=UPI0020076B93|nr:uncharacterized protein B0H18DRAFT_1215604 [Neoantrodia serialis]KAH9915224.1 hypothetical protein B0H18DRAFT_1215604 [Neoantrodia serialis]